MSNNRRLLQILLADDEQIVHTTIGDYLRQCGHSVEHAYDGREALRRLKSADSDLALLDVRMPGVDGLEVLRQIHAERPDFPIVLITAHGNLEMAVQALRLGASDFLTKPIKLLELDAVLIKTAKLTELRRGQSRLKEAIRGIQTSHDRRNGYGAFIGVSPAAEHIREQIHRVVDAGVETILLTGETGVGKEIVARSIHSLADPEKSLPFIAVSCPALSDALVNSELFGHVKGAFTGASADRAGCFELADGGTLFLDEIADLSPVTQAALLRVLETRTLRRVGGGKEIEVHVRIIAAANVDLVEQVQQGKFRRDLYYRLNLFALHLPPLRERREDILPLADHFLAHLRSVKSIGIPKISALAAECLINYDYPGNARELRNIIERAAILSNAKDIRPEHLSINSKPTTNTPSIVPSITDERTLLLRALERSRWNRRQAALELGMPYSTFRFKLQKYNIR